MTCIVCAWLQRVLLGKTLDQSPAVLKHRHEIFSDQESAMIKEFLTRIWGKYPKNQVYCDYVVQVVDGNTLQTQKVNTRKTPVVKLNAFLRIQPAFGSAATTIVAPVEFNRDDRLRIV